MDKLKERSQLGDFCAQFGLPDTSAGSKKKKYRDSNSDKPYRKKEKGPAPSSASAPAPRNECEYNSQNSQNFRARPEHSQGSKAQGDTKTPACAKCDMAERKHAQIAPSGSGTNRGEKRNGRRMRHKRIKIENDSDSESEVIGNDSDSESEVIGNDSDSESEVIGNDSDSESEVIGNDSRWHLSAAIDIPHLEDQSPF
ncbi:lisH domain-containing protein C1711.05-like [Solanum tuberosum]|uniref:lisH domain-containing protein C1711.05-like n=1 Tax=Solanum tuberosum TaxID=4113 RepID=UPI00073A2842|nr:PREDICTED: lisH domain-containing protein C1711.05-like [Solanum tuberosum]